MLQPRERFPALRIRSVWEGGRQPQVWLEKFGESSTQFTLAVWLTEDAARRNAAIRAAYMWELDTAMRKYGIANSLPQLDVHVRSLFGLKGADALEAVHDRNVSRAAEPAVKLAPHERAVLSRNDAKEDTQRAIREDAQRTSEGKPPVL